MRREIDQSVIDARNIVLVEGINHGISATQLGHQFGLTRERVCQIYFKKTGKSVRQLRLETRIQDMVRVTKERQQLICKNCKNPINEPHKRVFCSRYCASKFAAKRRGGKQIQCENCGTMFQAYRTAKYTGARSRFHIHACYFEYNRKMAEARSKKIAELLKTMTPKEITQKYPMIGSHYIYNVARKFGLSKRQKQMERIKDFLETP